MRADRPAPATGGAATLVIRVPTTSSFLSKTLKTKRRRIANQSLQESFAGKAEQKSLQSLIWARSPREYS